MCTTAARAAFGDARPGGMSSASVWPVVTVVGAELPINGVP